MTSFAILVMFAVAVFLAAWVVNGLVGLLSGERPRDTGSLWLDMFLSIFAVLELGWIGRILNCTIARMLSALIICSRGIGFTNRSRLWIMLSQVVP